MGILRASEWCGGLSRRVWRRRGQRLLRRLATWPAPPGHVAPPEQFGERGPLAQLDDHCGGGDLLWHVFGVDGFRCPRCGDRMVVRALVVRPPATLNVLRGLEQAAARAPPAVGAQAA